MSRADAAGAGTAGHARAGAGWRWLSYRSLTASRARLALDTGADEVCLVNLGGSSRRRSAATATASATASSPFARPARARSTCRPGTACTARGRGLRGRVRRAGPTPAIRCGRSRPRRCGSRCAARATPPARSTTSSRRSSPAHRLLVVEVLTPGRQLVVVPAAQARAGAAAVENDLEEVYAYRFERPEAFGVQRLYSRDGRPGRDVDGARPRRAAGAARIPPVLRAHGYHGYYLNALAAEQRSMAAEDDPDLAWTRRRWADMERDRRVPLDRKGDTMRIASAPVSFGIFELTADDAGLPDPLAVLDAMADDRLRGHRARAARLLRRRAGTAAALRGARPRAGGVVPADAAVAARAHRRGLRVPRPRPRHPRRDHPDGGTRPVALISDAFCEPERLAGAGRIEELPGHLALGRGRFALLVDNAHRAAERCRERGYDAAFHYHGGTYVETPREIDRFAERVDSERCSASASTAATRCSAAATRWRSSTPTASWPPTST